jgi:hypothetical protein
MKYLLDELQNYESNYGDQLAPGAVAKDVSFMGNHVEVQVATGKDVHNLTRSMHEKVDAVERKLGNQLGELARLVTSVAGGPTQPVWTPTEPCLTILPTTMTGLIPGTNGGRMADPAAVQTMPRPLPPRTPSIGSDVVNPGSRGTCPSSVPLPIAGVVIPDIKSGPGAWREAVRQWEEDEPSRDFRALRDWPREWYTGAMRPVTGSKRRERELVALAYER